MSQATSYAGTSGETFNPETAAELFQMIDATHSHAVALNEANPEDTRIAAMLELLNVVMNDIDPIAEANDWWEL
jgi:hypothetical protein